MAFSLSSKSRISDTIVSASWGILVVQANITYPRSRLRFRFFTKIAQKLARTADVIILGIIDDALDVRSVNCSFRTFPYLMSG